MQEFFSFVWYIFFFFFCFWLFFVLFFSELNSTQKVTTENLSWNKCKTWPVENSQILLKIQEKLAASESLTSGLFLGNLNSPNPARRGKSDAKFFSERFSYRNHLNPRSYEKVMAVLRTTVGLGFETRCRRAPVVATARIWWIWQGKTHELDSNTT